MQVNAIDTLYGSYFENKLSKKNIYKILNSDNNKFLSSTTKYINKPTNSESPFNYYKGFINLINLVKKANNQPELNPDKFINDCSLKNSTGQFGSGIVKTINTSSSKKKALTQIQFSSDISLALSKKWKYNELNMVSIIKTSPYDSPEFDEGLFNQYSSRELFSLFKYFDFGYLHCSFMQPESKRTLDDAINYCKIQSNEFKNIFQELSSNSNVEAPALSVLYIYLDRLEKTSAFLNGVKEDSHLGDIFSCCLELSANNRDEASLHDTINKLNKKLFTFSLDKVKDKDFAIEFLYRVLSLISYKLDRKNLTPNPRSNTRRRHR